MPIQLILVLMILCKFELMKIQIINGPNLNLLGVREKSIYGNTGFESYLEDLRKQYPDIQLNYYQSNVEGELINKLHEIGFSYDGVVLNAGAYTHTSVAIADAIAAITTPVIEVHISNVYKREEFRHHSMLAASCKGVIAGFGLESYRLGVESFII
jgi:3-dehydroquinate dehydratase-2